MMSLALAPLLAAMSLGSVAPPPPPPPPPPPSAPAARPVQSSRWLSARLLGLYVPRGDSDGDGSLLMQIDREHARVCYTLTTRRIGIQTRHARLHAMAGTGPAEPLLELDVTGPAGSSCVPLDPALADTMLAAPHQLFVTVRNRQFPQGALRGQLRKD